MLIFEGHKGYAASGLRPLAHSDQPRKAHLPAVRNLGEVRRRYALSSGKLLTNQTEWMSSERQADRGIAGADILYNARQRSRNAGLCGLGKAIKQAKYARRYLAEAAYRFNRRFRLREFVPRLARAMMLNGPSPERTLRLPCNFDH
jgi:hypothetical protein